MKNHVKNYKNIFIYDTSYKTFVSSILLGIRLNKIDGFIKIYDGIRYLVFLGHSIWSYYFSLTLRKK